MKLSIEVESFTTPNFVILKQAPGERQDGFSQRPSFSIKEVDAQLLSELCDDFRRNIFLKANKIDPKK